MTAPPRHQTFVTAPIPLPGRGSLPDGRAVAAWRYSGRPSPYAVAQSRTVRAYWSERL